MTDDPAYEYTGRISVGGLTVTHWAPRPTDAARLRIFLHQWCGTDYGAPDEALAASGARAQAKVKASGRRWSWLVLAADSIEQAAAARILHGRLP